MSVNIDIPDENRQKVVAVLNGTADFLTGLLEKHEKTAWMLRSFLA